MSESITVVGQPAKDEFLRRWDRELGSDRRCYGVKVCFAGCESTQVRGDLYRIGVRNILMSYYYLKGWLRKASVQEIAEDLGRFDFLFLDSGGLTLLQLLQEGRKSPLTLNQYAEQYYTDLEKFGHLFAGCAEVDIDDLGRDYMEERRNGLQDKGIPMVPVIQPHHPVDFYDDLGWFDRYPYIAVGSALLTDPKHAGYMNRLFKISEERGVMLHGRGATTADIVRKSPFYSVDSTSWRSGSRYGITMVFQNGRIRNYDKAKKDVRKRYKRRFEENGLNWDEIDNDKCREVDLMNALAWRQWADYVKYSASRSYWLTDEERDASLKLKSEAFNTEGLIDRQASIERAKARRLATVANANYDDRAHEILHCDTCAMEGRCPRFQKGQPCGYDVNVKLETHADYQKAVSTLIEVEYGRAMTGALFEKLGGGQLDANVSNEFVRLMGMVQQAKSIFAPRVDEEMVIKAKGSRGAVANMLASVFAPKGANGSGSGNTAVQRAANTVIEVPPADETE